MGGDPMLAKSFKANPRSIGPANRPRLRGVGLARIRKSCGHRLKRIAFGHEAVSAKVLAE